MRPALLAPAPLAPPSESSEVDVTEELRMWRAGMCMAMCGICRDGLGRVGMDGLGMEGRDGRGNDIVMGGAGGGKELSKFGSAF